MLRTIVSSLGIIFVLTVATLGMPGEASAGFVYLWKPGSIDCTIFLASGGKPASDDLVVCAVTIKEIAGFCKNPQGQSSTAKGTPYRLHGFAMKSSSSGSWIKTRNGNQTQTISITNADIQHALDVSNALQGQPFVYLGTATSSCPNGKWQWSGWQVTKADAVVTWVKIPTGGSVAYLTYPDTDTSHCRTVQLPNWNTDGTYTSTHSETVCDFLKEPFNYCSRFADLAGPDGQPADSGLRIYNSTPAALDVADSYYNVRECALWRDVNKDNAFNLSVIDPNHYDPDIANIVAPQTGNVDGGDDDTLGGIVLKSPYVYYTGECHQHGSEKGGGQSYNWGQTGPLKVTRDTLGNIISGDLACTGGSQLLDGTYDGTYP